MQFLSSLNRLYTLHCATNLIGVSWLTVSGPAGVPGTGGQLTLNDTNTMGSRFYRVRVQMR